MKFKTTLFIFLVVIASAVIPFGMVHAAGAPAPVAQEQTPDIFAILAQLEDLARTGGTLAGVALFFAAISNLGKRYLPDLFPDGSAPSWSLGFQVVTLITLVILQITGRADLVPVIDQNAGAIANVLNALLALGFQIYAARRGHEDVLAGLPGVGYSYSNRAAGTTISILESEEPL